MPAKQPLRPTAKDVAARAGVSIATVSYVLNGRGDRRVGADTQKRVLRAARALGYAPNESARSLRRRRTERVALIVNSVGVPAIDQMARDLHAAADEAGYGVITLTVDSPSRSTKAVELLQQRFADGAVFFGPFQHIADEALLQLARTDFPMVVISNTLSGEGIDVFRAPEYAASTTALDHLVASGRRRIAFLAHADEVGIAHPVGRQGAYHDAIVRHELPADPALFVPGAEERVAAYHAVQQLLSLDVPPDAIFAASDRAAIATIWAARDRGRALPDDLAVIGVGNIAEGLITHPQLSTVGPTTHDFIDVAQRLFHRLSHPGEPTGEEITRPWVFLPRQSG